MQKFQHRTRLSGDLKDGDCSLVIDNITQEDEGPYYFRIEFAGSDLYNYQPVTWLRVSDFTDKPTIFAGEIVKGKSVTITCIFNTTCDGTSPNLTWVTPTDVPPSVSSSVTQWNNTLTYTSVLTMTPAPKHHGQNLTCRVRYPSVSSEQTLTLTVQYKPEISRDSGCTRTPDVITCVCAARSNPPGELTWHFPLANLSGNQTHGRFQTWQVADGQLVTSSLTMGVGEGEEDVTAFCTVRNQHGEVMFAVSQWMTGGVSAVWITVLLTSSVILSMLLAGFFISRYIPNPTFCCSRRDARTKEKALEILDTTVSSTAHLTAPQDTERQRTSQIPLEVSPGTSVGEGEACNPVYANLRDLHGGGGPARSGETVIYSELHFQSIGPA
ncbi:sialic acid-binding Ig-like lectin 7 isoform X1 [Hypanus sabinus]|uniref:sialic acid-binding Ig-like lectin 7 isoform X1 n=1 Tax=Hypanus sabinus TaxID=79690 RepID=UPI0028C3DB63|nr:sialic acid-binding Ig-like lectin 7 isoform X1 [Hypanus sabinus]